MSRHKIRVAITGRGATPELVPLQVLAEVLASIERLVLNSADSSLEFPEGTAIGLVGIEEGSDGLVLSVPSRLVPAVALISQAVEQGDYTGLSESGVAELCDLSAVVVKHEWGFEFAANQEHNIHHAKIDPEQLPPRPEQSALIEGTTTVYGRCLRVGGARTPKAEIRLPSTENLLYADLSEEIAKELGKRLYEEVILEGSAVWDAETWQIRRFRISRITAYRQTDPVLAFKELSEASHGQWDSVDAAEYVRGLRSDG